MSEQHCVLMDKIYRYQRHIYDMSRKYFLLGRDFLVDSIHLTQPAAVLEVGCGTCRNLRILGDRFSEVELYGIDASKYMLAEARRSNRDLVESGRLIVAQGLAEEFSYQGTFGRDKPFDVVFFSYSLSMIPDWLAAIENALDNLKPDGLLAVVDFYHQRRMPGFFREILEKFLSLYHVKFDPLLPEELKHRGAQIYPLHFDYAFCAFLSPRLPKNVPSLL